MRKFHAPRRQRHLQVVIDAECDQVMLMNVQSDITLSNFIHRGILLTMLADLASGGRARFFFRAADSHTDAGFGFSPFPVKRIRTG
jgi:hypothetical protein